MVFVVGWVRVVCDSERLQIQQSLGSQYGHLVNTYIGIIIDLESMMCFGLILCFW